LALPQTKKGDKPAVVCCVADNIVGGDIIDIICGGVDVVGGIGVIVDGCGAVNERRRRRSIGGGGHGGVGCRGGSSGGRGDGGSGGGGCPAPAQ
jgi:hypothetical protein